MKYIIMADGKGTRWNNYNNIPKHFIEVDGETLLARTVRLLHQFDGDCEVIITSHNPAYEIEGAVRYEPKENVLEIDRFTKELIEDDICFLYGDTYYSDSSMRLIIEKDVEDLLFFGNEKSIVAVKVKDANVFRFHFERVRKMFLEGEIKNCKGWQVYQSFQNLSFEERVMANKYVCLKDDTQDFNVPEDWNRRRSETNG